MAGLERSRVIGQDFAAISSDLYDSLFLQSLLQHGSGSDIEGAHYLSTRTDIRSEWHHLLDDLCFLCDSEHAGQSVVSIAVEQGKDGITFWITTAERHQQSAECHLRDVLHILTNCSLEKMDKQSGMQEITRLSVQRSRDRISGYVNRLGRLVSKYKFAREDDAQSNGEMGPVKYWIYERSLILSRSHGLVGHRSFTG